MMMNEFGQRRGGYDDRWDGRWESPDWWLRDGRSYDGHLRRNGDWMREPVWGAREWTPSWGGAPWGVSPWAQGPWAQGPLGQGPWGQGPLSQGPLGQGPLGQGPLGQGPWGQGPWGQPWHLAWGQPWGQGPWARDWSRVEGGVEPMVKVIEVLAESPHSWEDATRRAIAEASQSVRGIRSIYIKDMQAVVEDERVIGYRINAKIAFTQDDSRRRR